MKKTGIRVDLVVGGVKGGLKVQNLIFGYLGSHTSGSNLIFLVSKDHMYVKLQNRRFYPSGVFFA